MNDRTTPSQTTWTMSNTILLKTDTPEFANDISDEIRLFLSDAHIITEDDGTCDTVICTSLVLTDYKWCARVTSEGDFSSEYTFEYPYFEGDALTVKRHKKRCIKIAAFRMMKEAFPNAFVPWGSLTGIRPTKLLRELEDDLGTDSAKDMMLSLFDTEPEKYAVAKETVDIQMPFIRSAKEKDVDIYIGIPYCKTRCLYCSFASEIRTAKTDMRPYIDALKEDIRLGAKLLHDGKFNIRAAYMGGGTPTVLTEDELEEVLDFALECYGTMGKEFTAEAGRPDTVTRKKLEILKSHGVGRISVNPQSMNEKTLQLIGRSHTPSEIQDAFYSAREVGFIINTDIITCLPGEGMRDVLYTLECIENMRPENMTVHTLALKRSSKLKQVIGDAEIASIMPDTELASLMVTAGMESAKKQGMNAYYMYRQKYMRGNLENIGYALPGTECLYNIDMMEETVSIMAHGAGSMSKRVFPGRSLRVERVPNPKDVGTYISKLRTVYEEKERLFLQ